MRTAARLEDLGRRWPVVEDSAAAVRAEEAELLIDDRAVCDECRTTATVTTSGD